MSRTLEDIQKSQLPMRRCQLPQRKRPLLTERKMKAHRDLAHLDHKTPKVSQRPDIREKDWTPREDQETFTTLLVRF